MNGRRAGNTLTAYFLRAFAVGAALLCGVSAGQTTPPDSAGASAGSNNSVHTGASVAGATAVQDGADAAIHALKFGDDAPPDDPKPPPALSPTIAASILPAPISPAVAPFVAKLPAADAASLHAIGETIARQLNQTQDENQRRFLVDAGTQVLKEIERRDAAKPADDPRGRTFAKPDIEKTAYRQALSIANKTVGLVNAGNVDAPQDPIKEISRSAWEGGEQSGNAVVAPGGTNFFSHSVAAPANNATPNAGAANNSAAVPAENRPAPHLIYVPPPASSSQIVPKGVRIAFDPATLRLAEKHLPSLDMLEDQLRDARTPNDVSQSLAWLDGRMNQAISGQGTAVELDHATVVSLRTLVAMAEHFRDHWDSLPENLRHPGQLRRLHGLLIDARQNDLLLVGSSDGPGEPISIDELIVGFRSVWRDAATPLCSLEPDPGNVGGPQTAVIAGVNRDTEFARVMLDADYTMKRLIFGQERIDSPGFVDLHAAYAAYFASQGKENAALAEHWTARFWFMPVPPAEGSIRLSPGGNLAMFDCRVQVLTENLAQRGGSFRNIGTRNPVVERMTSHFSEHFDLFENRFPVIRELHALCDIALAAQVARRMNAPRDLLTAFVNLPIRDVEVPATYAGLNIPIEVANLKVGAIQGGVNMVAAVTPSALARVADAASERFAQQALASSGIERPTADAHPRYIASALTTSLTGDTPLARADGLIAGGSYNAALAILDAELAKDPEDIPARRCRMRALAGRGLFHLAERELEIIAMLEESPDTEDLRLKLHLDRGDPIVLESIPPDRQARLLSLYLNEAISQAAASNYTKAIETAGRALALAPGDGALLARRAQWELAGGDAAAAMADFQKAIDLSPRSGKPLLARAQAYERLGRLDDALRDADRALELDPSLSEAYCVRLEVALFHNDADLKSAYNDTRKVEALTPNDPMIYVYRAQILAREGDRDGAMAAANRAVKFGPGIAQAYIVRGRLLGEQLRGLANFANFAEQQENQDRFIRALSDYNAAIGLRPDDWQSHEMRAAALVDLAGNIGEPSSANLDWQKLLTVALGSMVDSSRAVEVLGHAFGSMSSTNPNVPVAAAGIKLGLLYAADDDLNIAVAHAPNNDLATIQPLAAQVRQQIHALTGERLP